MTESWVNRSIVSVKPARGGVEVVCDCATVTVLTFDAVPDQTTELAFTCDGCSTVHWYTLVPGMTVTRDEPRA